MRIYRKLLCLVLVALLMTSSVFAMTVETEEAKKAIVETRVKKELLTGQVTSSEDVIRVALEHCDAPIAKDGMTASIDEDGRIQVTQVLNTAAKSNTTSKEIAVTKLVITDPNGVEAANTIYTDYVRNSGGMNEYSIFATHTSYYSIDVSPMWESLKVRLSYMTTTLTYGTTIKASKLQQVYGVQNDAFTADLPQYSAVISSPEAGKAYSYTPSTRKWYSPTTVNVNGRIETRAIITVGSQTFDVKTSLEFKKENFTQYG